MPSNTVGSFKGFYGKRFWAAVFGKLCTLCSPLAIPTFISALKALISPEVQRDTKEPFSTLEELEFPGHLWGSLAEQVVKVSCVHIPL